MTLAFAAPAGEAATRRAHKTFAGRVMLNPLLRKCLSDELSLSDASLTYIKLRLGFRGILIYGRDSKKTL